MSIARRTPDRPVVHRFRNEAFVIKPDLRLFIRSFARHRRPRSCAYTALSASYPISAIEAIEAIEAI